MAFDVFLSYAVKDKTTADATCASLEAAGIRCWIAPRDIVHGMDWGEAIIDAISSAKLMVLVFSGHANASVQIKREVERAVNKGIPVIPLRLEDVPMSKSLEYFLSTPHWLDAISPPLEEHLQRLCGSVKVLLKHASGAALDDIENRAKASSTASDNDDRKKNTKSIDQAYSSLLFDLGFKVEPKTSQDRASETPSESNEYVGKAYKSETEKEAFHLSYEAMRHAGNGDYVSAIRAVSKGIEIAPSYIPSYGARAGYYIQTGNYDGALADLNREFDPSYMSQSYKLKELGRAYAGKKDYSKAIEIFNEAIGIEPQNSDLYSLRGTVYAAQGNQRQALEDFELAIGLGNSSSYNLSDAFVQRGRIFMERGNLDRALRDFDEAVRKHEFSSNAYAARGELHAKKGEFDRAIADLDKAIRFVAKRNLTLLAPNASDLHRHRGAIFRATNQYEKAISSYTVAVLLDPTDALSIYARGLSKQASGDKDGAEEDFERAVAIDPNITALTGDLIQHR